MTKESELEHVAVSLLVGIQGQLFIVSNNFAVMRSTRGYAAIGTGRGLRHGSSSRHATYQSLHSGGDGAGGRDAEHHTSV